MSHELMITSAPRGLQPGSMGFCTVAMTPQLPSVLQQRLETLSSYRHVYPPMDARAKNNPVCFQHLRLQVGGKNYSILSRIGDTGLDYTERSNKFGHHLALSPTERSPAGPAATMLNPRTFQTAWKGEPRELEPQRSLAAATIQPGVARQWKAATGDAGWAGVLAEMYLENQKDPVYVEYPAGTDVLPLFAEALAQLPEEERWGVTFSTYFQGLPPELTCHWRGIVKDSPEAKQAHSRNARIIPIQPGATAPQGGVLATWARTGAKPAASEITISHEDNDLSPLTLKPDRKQPRPVSGQPFELKRSNQAKASFQSDLPLSRRSSFSVMSLLMGLLLGFLLSAMVGLGLWFANKTDPSLVVAQVQKPVEEDARVKELQKQLIDEQHRRESAEKQSASAENTLSEEKEKNQKLKNSLDEQNKKLVEANAKLVKNEDKGKAGEKLADPPPPGDEPVSLEHERKKAIYFDYTTVKSASEIAKPDESLISKLGDDAIRNANWKSVKLYRPKELLVELKDSHLKDRPNKSGILLYKETSSSSAKNQPIFELRINASDKLEGIFYVENKSEARNEAMRLLKYSIIELESNDKQRHYITGIQPILEDIHNVIFINGNDLDSHEKRSESLFDRRYTISSIVPSNVKRIELLSIVKVLVKNFGNTLRYDIKYDFTPQISNKTYYTNTLTIDPINSYLTSCDAVVNIRSRYNGYRSNDPVNKEKITSDYITSVNSNKLKSVTINSLSLFFNMHGVDVLIWQMAPKSSTADQDKSNPLETTGPRRPTSGTDEAKP
ncbi:MAG: hypothetical protein QM775_28290 [Pirellulales bacterium]